jgi:hypothetical protein
LCGLALISWVGCGPEGPYFIPGSAQLPDCSEEPIADLDGTEWFDTGTVTIQTAGCEGTAPGDVLTACALNWVFSQEGNEVTIVVDSEYRIKGRLCGDELYLRGGWWLPVEDEGVCTYDDDSAAEVSIQDGGSILRVDNMQMTGTLSLQAGCRADYAMALSPVP